MADEAIRGLVERLRAKARDRSAETKGRFMPDTYIEWQAADALSSLQSKVEGLEKWIQLHRGDTLSLDGEVTLMRNHWHEAESRALAAEAKVERMAEALTGLVYETTHLSPERDDGSHDCRISKDALEKARRALAEVKP